jgi:predicted CopG family antitoxin
MAETKTIMKGELTISPDAYNTLVKLKEELEDVIETIEIMNDRELMDGLKRSKKDVEEGRVYELKNVDDLDELWK